MKENEIGFKTLLVDTNKWVQSNNNGLTGFVTCSDKFTR